MNPTNFDMFNYLIAHPLDIVDSGYSTPSNNELLLDAIVIMSWKQRADCVGPDHSR